MSNERRPGFTMVKDKPLRGQRTIGVSIDDATWFPVDPRAEEALYRFEVPWMNSVEVSHLEVDPMPFLLAMRR